MKNIFCILIVAGGLIIAPALVFAQPGLDEGPPSYVGEDPCPEGEVCVVNPLGRLVAGGDVVGFLSERLGGALNVLFGLIAVASLIPIVFGGIQLITSQGVSEKVQKGKNALYWGVVGLVIAFSGIVVFNFLLGVLIQ